MANTENLQPGILHICLKGQGFAQLIVLAFYLSDFIYKMKTSKQKLICMSMSIILNFLAGFLQNMSITKIKLSSVTSVIFGFILNVAILII